MLQSRSATKKLSKFLFLTTPLAKFAFLATLLFLCQRQLQFLRTTNGFFDSMPEHSLPLEEQVDRQHSCTIFYNVYTAEGHMRPALTIIRRQLHQIASSLVEVFGQAARKIPLKINTIGYNVSTRSIMSACRSHTGLKCQHLDHFLDGNFEDVTLSAIHDHCQTQADNHVVVYVHSKGTYHPSEKNNIWRDLMTNAVLSKGCLELGRGYQNNTESSCNVCGFLFQPIWTFMFPGNMWSAQCGYVRKLKHPRLFKANMDFIADDALDLMQHGHFTMNLAPPLPVDIGRLGQGRHADEHWIGSHPSIFPCDVAPNSNLWKWVSPPPEGFVPGHAPPIRWSPAPRYSIFGEWGFYRDENESQTKRMLRTPEWRSREYFLLPGFLWKWLRWYNEVPPPNSFVWKWFPDGEMWLERSRQLNAEQLLTYISGALDSPLPTVATFESSVTNIRPPLVYFMHIDLPAKEDNQNRIVQQQLAYLSSSFKTNTTIFVYTSGGLSSLDTTVLESWCRLQHQLNCKHVQHYPAALDIITQTRVQDFCRLHETFQVAFLSGPSIPIQSLDALHACWEDHRASGEEESSCDVCLSNSGLENHDRMLWISQCSFVKDLIASTEHAAAMSSRKMRKEIKIGKYWVVSKRPNTTGAARVCSSG
jgi:hypothetical protein